MASENFLIEIIIDGETFHVVATPEIVEMLNSEDKAVREHATRQLHSSVAASRAQVPKDSEDINVEGDHVTDSSSTASAASTSKMWSENDMKALFEMRREREQQFQGIKGHATLWTKIAKDLQAMGINVTSSQCINKWKSLRREFRKVLDHNAKTGSEKKTCPFFEELSEMYGHRSGTSPAFVMSSGVEDDAPQSSCDNQSQSSSQSSCDNQSQSSSQSRCDTPTQSTSTACPKPKATGKSKQLKKRERSDTFLQELATFNALKKERLEQQQSQHIEKMSILREVVDALYGLNLKEYFTVKPSASNLNQKDLTEFFTANAMNIDLSTKCLPIDSCSSTKCFSNASGASTPSSPCPFSNIKVGINSTLNITDFHTLSYPTYGQIGVASVHF